MNRIGNALDRHIKRHDLKLAVGAKSGQPKPEGKPDAPDPLNLGHLRTWTFSKTKKGDGDKKVYLHQGFHGQDIVSGSKRSWAAGLATRFLGSPTQAKARFHDRACEAFRQQIDAMDLDTESKEKLQGRLEKLLFKQDITIADVRGMFLDITKAETARKEMATEMAHAHSLPTPTLPEPPQAPRPVERLVAAPLKMPSEREKTVMQYAKRSHDLRSMHQHHDAAFREKFGSECVDDFTQVFAPKIKLQFNLYPDRFEQLRSEGETPIKQFMRRELKERGIAAQDLTKGLETLLNTTPLLGVLEKDTSDALIGTYAGLKADQSTSAVGNPRKEVPNESWTIDEILRGTRTTG